MRILICDNDSIFAKKFSCELQTLADQSHWHVSIDCVVHLNTLEHMDIRQFDIIFLETKFETTTGIHIARKIRTLHPNIILIFVTNHEQYSIEAYEVLPLRYLLKHQLDQKLPECFSALVSAYQKERHCIRLCIQKEEIDIIPNHITYVETEGRHLKLHLHNDIRKVLVISTTMKHLNELLKNWGFLRIHQSYLVNMQWIQKIQSTGVQLSNDVHLPISTRNYNALKKHYSYWKETQ